MWWSLVTLRVTIESSSRSLIKFDRYHYTIAICTRALLSRHCYHLYLSYPFPRLHDMCNSQSQKSSGAKENVFQQTTFLCIILLLWQWREAWIWTIFVPFSFFSSFSLSFQNPAFSFQYFHIHLSGNFTVRANTSMPSIGHTSFYHISACLHNNWIDIKIKSSLLNILRNVRLYTLSLRLKYDARILLGENVQKFYLTKDEKAFADIK